MAVERSRNATYVIDCRTIGWSHSGIARYTKLIVQAVIGDLREGEKIVCIMRSGADAAVLGKNPKMSLLFLDARSEIHYQLWLVPLALNKLSPCVFWSPTQDLPLWLPRDCISMCTVHDLSFERYPKWFSWKVRVYAALRLYRRAARRAVVVCADSIFTAREVTDVYGIPQDKIEIVYPPIDRESIQRIAPDAARSEVKIKYGITGPFIFCVDSARVDELVAAFVLISRVRTDLQLVLLGKFDADSDRLKNAAAEAGLLSNLFIIREHVSDSALATLYSAAVVYCSTSRYEGFGLTPMEALWCGTPIALSRRTAHPEIYEHKAEFFDPDDPCDIARAILKTLSRGVRVETESPEMETFFETYSPHRAAKKILEIFRRIQPDAN